MNTKQKTRLGGIPIYRGTVPADAWDAPIGSKFIVIWDKRNTVHLPITGDLFEVIGAGKWHSSKFRVSDTMLPMFGLL